MLRCAIIGIEHMHISALYGSLAKFPDEVEFIGWADSPQPDSQEHEKKARVSLGKGYDLLKYYPDWLELAAERPDLALVCADNTAHTARLPASSCLWAFRSYSRNRWRRPMPMQKKSTIPMLR